MDRNNIERPKKFNQREYNDKYRKEHYRKFQTNLKPDVAERINNYCTDVGISKAEFLQRAIDILDN